MKVKFVYTFVKDYVKSTGPTTVGDAYATLAHFSEDKEYDSEEWSSVLGQGGALAAEKKQGCLLRLSFMLLIHMQITGNKIPYSLFTLDSAKSSLYCSVLLQFMSLSLKTKLHTILGFIS